MQPKFYGAAAQYNRPTGFNFGSIIKIGLLGLGIILLITAGFFAFNLLTSGTRDDASRLLTRERQLLTFLNNNRGSISNESLSTLTSNAISLLNSDIYNIQQVVRGFGVTTIPDTILQSESDTTSTKLLATAALQSRFDAQYWQLFNDKIASAQQLASKLAGELTGTSHTNIQTNVTHLQSLSTKLGTFKF